jgi:adenosylmethionine-8-amino-7-oxononanoate aminotransferase
LTGGALALSATLVGQSLYDVFLGAPNAFVHFLHGHSYAGNPIACAAALASLALFEEEGTLERAQGIARRSRAPLESLRAHPLVHDVRQAGTMLGIELRKSLGPACADALYDAGHFTRPIGDVIQFVPPLCSSDEEVDGFFESLSSVLVLSPSTALRTGSVEG